MKKINREKRINYPEIIGKMREVKDEEKKSFYFFEKAVVFY